MKRIINHFTDNDLYTFTCMYYVLKNYPKARVKYKFFDRNKEKYPKGFGDLLIEQVNSMVDVVYTDEEFAFMQEKCKYLPLWFLYFLKGYKFNPNEVKITQDEEGYLDITIEGYWWSTIMWEMVLLACISELSHMLNGDITKVDLEAEYIRAQDKAIMLLSNGLKFCDMGTRRRLSFDLQDTVVRAIADTAKENSFEGAFLGTSNVWFAMKYGLNCIGTMSHQIIEAEEVVSGVFEANKQVIHKWNDTFNGYLAIFLYDCFGEKAYFNTVTKKELKMIDGVRVDSGEEIDQLRKHIAKFCENSIDPKNRSIVFSNALNGQKAIRIHKQVANAMCDSYGIGTWLTCSFDKTDHVDSLDIKNKNIVIKLVGFSLDGTTQIIDCVKLSCDEGKTLGNKEKCKYLANVLSKL